VRQCLEQEGRTNVLATSDRTGKVNVAMFGSYRLMDDSSVIVMLSDNRTMANLRENPHAACLVMLHGTGGMATEGCRLYMKVRSIEDEGETWSEVRQSIRKRIGNAADMLRHLVWFDM
jgi:hypothetical protein